MKLLIRLSIFLTLASIFMIRCANQSAPTGGPKDSLAPVVVRTSPAMYTTNFKGKKIFIEFNEYVQLKDQSKLFFVSPPGTQKPRLTIKKKGIEILFEEALDSATTYRLDFGSSIVDNNEGNKLDGFSFVFSTGDHIDSLVMTGQTISAYERDTVINSYLFFIDAKADSLEIDSTFFNGKVEAMFRTDSSGYFIADILKDKEYRVYALDDKNGDQRYQPGTDRIGFLNRTFNPTKLGGFSLTFDSLSKRITIDSLQARFELFTEIPVRRQLITKQERPERQKIVMTFNSLNPKMDSIIFDSIPPSWIIRENGIVGDSVTFWIAPPTKELIGQLTDTIKGTMLLEKEDSVWQKFMSKEKLTFSHKIFNPEKSRSERRQEAAAENPDKPSKKRKNAKTPPVSDSTDMNGVTPEIAEPKDGDKKAEDKLKFKVIAETTLNPENHIAFEFDYPLRGIDSSKIELYHFEKISVGKGRDAKTETKEVKTPFTIVNSPNNLKHWEIRANWKVNDEYRLMIPPNVFEDITFKTNDSLESKFTIANPDKFGTLIIKSTADSTDQNLYIYELIQGQGSNQKVISRKKGIDAGETVTFSYLKAGVYSVRIIQDENRNGKWDTGELTLRRQPEKARLILTPSNGAKQFPAKENHHINEIVDLKKMFEQ